MIKKIKFEVPEIVIIKKSKPVKWIPKTKK